MKKIILLFILFHLSIFAHADESSYNQRLRKITILLKGTLPANEDLVELSELSSDREKNEFISDKINEYFESEEYKFKMVNRLEELYQLRVSDDDERAFQVEEDEYRESISNSLNHLFGTLISENQSWDKLLTETDYSVPLVEDYYENGPFPEFYFYKFNHSLDDQAYNDILTYLESVSDTSTVVPLKSNNPDGYQNLAGSITTERFFQRYPTTQINANRKRAAAIFRIFLCDDMTPVILPSATENQDLLKLSLNTTNTAANPQIQNSDIRHGQDSQCQTCHHKLEPMAETLIGSSVVPNAQPSSGALVFYEEMLNGNFEKRHITVSGLNELGHQIVNQQQYLSCQVSHFWNWFVGENIPLPIEKKYELSQKFDDLGRRPSDFIHYLLNSDDFKFPNQIDVNDIRYSNVKPIFKHCDSCHAGEITAPVLSNGYPFSTVEETQFNLLKKIITSTDLHEQKEVDYMPPQDAGWALNSFERNLLKAWMISGAKDDNGNLYIDRNADVISEINFDSNFIENANYKFHNTNLRYLSNFDLPNIISSIYFGSFSSGNCGSIDSKNNLAIFGFRDPSTGEPLIDQPNFLLFDWIANCVRNGMGLRNSFDNYLPQNTTKEYSETSAWSDITDNDKISLIQKNMDLLIGYNTLSPEDNDLITVRILESLNKSNPPTLRSVLTQIHTIILTSAEFLIY